MAHPEQRRPRRRPGLAGLTRLRSLLGELPEGWALEKAELRGLELELVLTGASGRLALFLARGPADAAQLRARVPEEELDEEELAALRAAQAGAASARYSELLARLDEDCLLYADPEAGFGASRFERYFQVVDHSPDFWKFAYPQTRFLEDEIRFGVPCARVHHSTLECRVNGPQSEVASLRLFADKPRPRAEEDAQAEVETSLSEADVVGGRTQAILGEALARAAERKPAFIHLKTTCLPELVGDNPTALIARLTKETGVPVLWTSKTRDERPAYAAAVARMLDEGGPSAERDPRSVILAGVPSPEAAREAASLCAALGLRVAGEMFPELQPPRAPGAGTAGGVVWLDPVGWEKIEDDEFLRRGLAVVRTHPPFGLAGTRRWLERVAEVLGLGPAEAAFDAALAPLRPELERLARECRGRRVALIGDPADLEFLAARGRGLGFSTAGLLCELGFEVRCLVWSGGGAGDALRRARARQGAGAISFEPFSTRAQLDRALGRGVDLAFSHLSHDPRLEAHGLLGFTEAAFEPGLEGMIRTGRRLLRRCAGRPFPAHRRFLRRWDP